MKILNIKVYNNHNDNNDNTNNKNNTNNKLAEAFNNDSAVATALQQGIADHTHNMRM